MLVGHDDVGTLGQFRVLTDGGRSLRGVQEGEQATGPQPPLVGAARGLEEHDIGSCVGQELRAVRTGDAPGAVDDPDAGQGHQPALTDDRGRKYGRLTPSPTGRKSTWTSSPTRTSVVSQSMTLDSIW